MNGPDQGVEFDLHDRALRIGREESNAIKLYDRKVSRQHAEVVHLEDGRFQVRDLGSSHGTRVNGTVIQETALNSGDELQVGNTVLSVVLDEVGADPGEPAEADWREGLVKATSAEEGKKALLGKLADVDHAPALRKAQDNLLTIYNVTAAVNSVLNIEELLEVILDTILNVINADRGFIALWDEEADDFDPASIRRRGEDADGAEVTVSRTMVRHVMESGEGILTSDAMADSRFKGQQSIVAHNIRSAMCAPLRSKDKVLGIINIDTKLASGEFTEDDLQLLTIIGSEAGAAVDNARLVEANLKAERLAAIGQTIAGLAHDIKNILQGMNGGALLVQQGMESKNFDLLNTGWGVVSRNEKRLSDMVLDMLNFSKEREPEYVPSDINELVLEVVDLMQQKGAQNAVSVEGRPADEDVQAEVDPKQIHRAMLNLVSNAIDAIEAEEGRVQVSAACAEQGDEVHIHVADNGSGIAEESLKKIFDPFVSSKGSKGTGLGLALVKKIVDEHRGTIEAQSTLGEGTTFTLRLPRTAPGRASQPPEGEPPVDEATDEAVLELDESDDELELEFDLETDDETVL